jgi:hypothetical protein
MRNPVTIDRVREFMDALGQEAEHDGRAYFTGGVSAVLMGWRASTIDVDLKLIPEQDSLFRALPRLKESLHLNVELAAPDQFIPELPGWRERSALIDRCGRVSFHHYDFYAQALAKIERGHLQDMDDVAQMLKRGLVSRPGALELFAAIEPQLFRYPAIDPPSFRRAVESALQP